MTKRRLTIGLCSLLLSFTLAGCGEKKEAGPITGDTVEILSDGSVVEYQLDVFDKNYYNIGEYEGLLREEISEYNKETLAPQNDNGKPLVSVKSIGMNEANPTQAETVLEFQSTKALVDYYSEYGVERKFFYGPVSEAITKGYDVKGNLCTLKKGELIPLSDEQIEKIMSRNILIVTNENIHVRYEGKLLYYSNNVTFDENKTEATTVETGDCYFVFE